MVGGEAADFARMQPLFAAIAKNVFHVGPSGAGCVAKLVTQYLGYTNFIAALEGMLIAAKAGIDLGILARIVPVSAGQSRTFDNIARSVLTGAFTSGGTLDIVAKDIDLACALAREVGAPVTLGRPRVRDVQARTGPGLGPGGLSGGRPGAGGEWPGRSCAMSDRAINQEDGRITRLLLVQEIADFLYREAELLDERRYEDWLALLADDIRYWMPMRRNVKFGEGEQEFTREGTDIAWFDEGKETLTRRVRQIQTGIHWAEEPQSRIAHLVSNVQVVEASPSLADPQDVAVKCRFLIYRNRVETETDLLVGKREDWLRRVGTARGVNEWHIARRKIILDQNVLLSKNLTFFF